MLAQVTNMVPGEFTWMGGDCHLYENTLEQVDIQLEREPYPAPELKLNSEVKDLFAFTAGDITLVDYRHHDVLSAMVAV